jgi:hypothetical protein
MLLLPRFFLDSSREQYGVWTVIVALEVKCLS